jgi:prepilin peptidase dependent protein A/type IV fimbrial biogenesis protein FimT
MNFQKGFTLFELMITMTIIAIIVMVGVPSFLQIKKNIQLKGAIESSYFAFQHARSAAISNGSDVTLSINPGTNWCIGISNTGDCDCNILNSCTVNGIEQQVKSSDFSHISMRGISFGASSIAVFDGVRGLSIGNAGSMIFSDGSNEAKLILSNMGRVRICIAEGDLGSYSSC